VARCLASLFDPHLYPHTNSFIQLTQEEIGLLSATSRQRANQALQALENAELIKIEFKGIRVVDLPGLRRYSGGAEARHVLKGRSNSSGAQGSRSIPARVAIRK
jgi:CRP/FNR family cyclic AMP-dependent transcriptional regulator